MKTIKLLIMIILLSFGVKTFAQDDFDVRLTETEINKTLDAIISARGLNFGEYNGEDGIHHWIANINAAHIDILPDNIVHLVVDDLYFLVNIDVVAFDFNTTEHFGGVINGEFVLEGNETEGYKIVLQLNSVDINSWGDLGWLPGYIADLFYSEDILLMIPDINLSLTNITPGFFSEAFNLGSPPISTDNESVYLNYNVKGDRFVTVTNELEHENAPPVRDIGYVYSLENGAFVEYTAGFEFAWDKNSSHTIKTQDNGIDYEADNNHYKFKNWDDGNTNVFRNIFVVGDWTYKAQFYKTYLVNFSASYEGISEALT